MLDRFRNFFRKEQPIINHPLPRGNKPEITVRYSTAYSGASSWARRDYEQLVALGYSRNSDVYACVSLIATAAKQVKWDMTPGSQARESISLLEKSGGPSFIEQWISYILLSGNSYVEIGRNGANKPVELHLIQPHRVNAVANMEARYPGEVEMWKVRDAKGRPFPVLPPDMMHSKLFNPTDPIYGMAPLEAAMLRVEAQNEGASFMKRSLARGHSPGWIEAAENSIWEETHVASLRQQVAYSKQAGEELFLENAKWHEMEFKAVDADISNQQLLSKRDIASVFHVDPALIGDTSTRTYATYRESRQALYMEAVIPLLEQFKEDWNRMIARGNGMQNLGNGSELMFDKDSFDGIAAARNEACDRVHKLWTAGLITQNEGRSDLAYDPPKPGDVFYGPANFVPLANEGTEE